MARTGRPPVPTETLKARGTYRADRHGSRVQYAPGKAAPPAHLDAEARREWKRLVPVLMDAGVFAATDRGLLAMYCAAWSEWVALCQSIATSGPLVTINSQVVPNPLLKQRDRAADRLESLATHFGFSPVARGRVQADAPAKPSLKARYFDPPADDA